MAEWRFSRGWTQTELAARLSAAAALQPSVPADAVELVPETGWNHVVSHASLGFEEPGPPRREGAFDHARTLVARCAFSDARIVVVHFAKEAPLNGRDQLLELKSMGLRFLCPARVGAVRAETEAGGERSVFGFRLDTLRGHVERGREWFLLMKDHATGEISFRVEAGWLPGEFPNWWSEAGFHVLGRRYQRAWHRLAHEHLRASLRDWDAEDRRARGRAPAHDGPALAPVQFLGQKALRPRRIAVEREVDAHG